MMNIHINIADNIADNAAELGKRAAKKIAALLNDAIREKGSARMILSTGASQFETLEALVKEDVDWTKVEMFHLDEYVGLDESHPASFRKYLKERFVSKVRLKAAWFVENEECLDNLLQTSTRMLHTRLSRLIQDAGCSRSEKDGSDLSMKSLRRLSQCA